MTPHINSHHSPNSQTNTSCPEFLHIKDKRFRCDLEDFIYPTEITLFSLRLDEITLLPSLSNHLCKVAQMCKWLDFQAGMKAKTSVIQCGKSSSLRKERMKKKVFSNRCWVGPSPAQNEVFIFLKNRDCSHPITYPLQVISLFFPFFSDMKSIIE